MPLTPIAFTQPDNDATLNNPLDFTVEENNLLKQALNISLKKLHNANDEIAYLKTQLNKDYDPRVALSNHIEDSEFNRSVLNSSPDCIKILDAEGRIQYMNNNGICLMEIDDFNKVKNSYWWDLWEENKHQLIKDTVRKALGGERVQFQSMSNSAKGTSIWWDVVVSPIVSNGSTGRVQRIIAVSRDITNLKEATVKVEESEERYNNLITYSPSAIGILQGEDLIITTANAAIIEIWGKGEDIIGKPYFEALPELAEQGYKEVFHEVYTSGKPFNAVETPVNIVQNGKMILKYYNFLLQAQRNIEGDIEGIGIIASEVTTQALANKKIKASEEQFRLLVLQAPVSICVLRGENYEIEVINEGMLGMWDRTLEQTLTKPAFDVLPELKEQGFKELLDNVYKTGERFIAEELPINLKRSGKLEKAYVKFVYEPLREADGTISGVMALAHEITEQVVARKKLEVQSLLFEDMLMTAPGFVATLSGPDHVYELVNAQYQSLFGKRLIKGKPIMEALPELEGQGFDILLDSVYYTGKPYVGIDVPIILARDENLAPELRYFNFSYQPMYDENKNIFSILVFGYETTDEVIARNKNLETEQLHLKQLEEKVQQRTLELRDTNSALAAKNDELVKLNIELESFTYISSHDLQEPLRKIQTFAGRITTEEFSSLSDNGKKYFKKIEDAAKRMKQLINDLLTFSSINSSERKFENTNLKTLIEDIIEDLKETIHEKQATVDIQEMGEIPVIRFQFRQLMENLMTNALKFSKKDVPLHVIITSKVVEGNKLNIDGILSNKHYSHISITDNGIGFNHEFHRKIFEVFQKVHSKTEYAGTGIGLAIVKKIVENHNGVIIATGELNKGATFDIYIPVLS